MGTEVLRLFDEPSGDDYVRLLRGLARLGARRALFAYPRRRKASSRPTDFEREIAVHADVGYPAKHHGTVSRGYYVVAYTLNEELLRFLETRVRSLFAWHGPLGEDLTLERRDGSPMLITVTHERIGMLVLSESERVALAKSWPGLEAHTAPRWIRPGR